MPLTPADQHRIDQKLASLAESVLELVTIYKTLLRETGDQTVALELTKAWLAELWKGVREQQRGPES